MSSIVMWAVSKILVIAGPILETYGIAVSGVFATKVAGALTTLLGLVGSWFSHKKALNTPVPPPIVK